MGTLSPARAAAREGAALEEAAVDAGSAAVGTGAATVASGAKAARAGVDAVTSRAKAFAKEHPELVEGAVDLAIEFMPGGKPASSVARFAVRAAKSRIAAKARAAEAQAAPPAPAPAAPAEPAGTTAPALPPALEG